MSYNFKSLNTYSVFAFKPGYDLSSPDSYMSLEELFNEDGEGMTYNLRGLFINKKTEYVNTITGEKESPVFLLDDFAVNVPAHQISEAKAILADQDAIDAIDAGECLFHIEQYTTKKRATQCYKVVFD